jgi:putative ABC transport system permease protein
MSVTQTLAAAAQTLWRRKIRALLMMAGVLVGVLSLTVLSSVGEATRQVAVGRFKNMLGTFDTLIVRPGGGKSRGMVSVADTPSTLSPADAEAISRVANVTQVVQVENVLSTDVSYRDRHETPGVFGVSPNWARVRGEQLVEGEFLTPSDDQAQARVAVLGAEARTRLFPSQDPLGKTVRIGSVPFQIKGVLAARGAAPTGASLDNLLFVPVSTAAKRLFDRDELTMVIAQVTDEGRAETTRGAIKALLRQRHRIAPSAIEDFTVTSPRAVMSQITAFGGILQKLVVAAAAIAGLLGGVAILVVMLSSVAARRREIGVRRAVGASRRAILSQFLAEAVIVSVAGGLAGVLLGLAATQLVSVVQHLPFRVAPLTLAAALVAAVAVGLASGVLPAFRAARIDPIEALKA